MKARVYNQFLHLLWHHTKNILLSPFHWCVIGIFWLLLGYIFALLIEQTGRAYLGAPIWWCALFSMMGSPLLCMNLFSKNNRADFTLLLQTIQIPTPCLVLSHYVPLLLIFLIIDSSLLVQWAFLQYFGNPDAGLHASAFLGLFGLQAAYLSLGILCAALTRSNLSSLFSHFGILVLSWLLYYANHLFQNNLEWVSNILRELSLYKHFYAFLQGAFFEHDALALLICIILPLYFASLALKK